MYANATYQLSRPGARGCGCARGCARVWVCLSLPTLTAWMLSLSLSPLNFAGLPIAAQASAREFGLNSTDGTQMTLIGGLMYNGGPGANTAMHGLAAMVPKLRAQSGAYGLVYVQSTRVASGPHLPARCSVS